MIDDQAERAEAARALAAEILDQPVASAQPLTGGASRETFAIGSASERFILRVDRGSTLGNVTLRTEQLVMAAASEHGVPVPAVRGSGHSDELGDYLLMAFVPGETIPRKILRGVNSEPGPQAAASQLGAVLAKIHRTPVNDFELRAHNDPIHALQAYGDPTRPLAPGLALGLRWLELNRPEPSGHGLVHADFRLGNLIINDGGIAAVLDWELAHLGDPAEDLGWLCAKVWRFGSELAAGGLASREDMLTAYEREAGWRPSPALLHWWELYATVKWGLICGMQAARFLDGAETSVELAAIGRRTAEQEWDVLLALGATDREPSGADSLDGSRADPTEASFGTPSADDLLRAIGLYLDEDVLPLGGQVGFHARVASNVVDIVRRQLQIQAAGNTDYRAGLDRLGVRDEAALAIGIASGRFDQRFEEVSRAIGSMVRTRLAAANPAYLNRPW